MASLRLRGLSKAQASGTYAPIGAVEQLLGKSGAYYFCGSAVGGSTTSNTLLNGQLRVAPWAIASTCTIDKLFAEVTAAGDAGCTFMITIYADDGQGYPGALVASAAIAADSIGVKEVAANATLPAGLYHVGGVVQGVATTVPTMRVLAATTNIGVPLQALPAAGTAAVGLVKSGITGAIPNPYPAWPASSAGNVARIGVHVT